jgi:hypothetical protein
MSLFFRTFQHLLPRSEAWKVTINKALRRLFLGLAGGVPEASRTFVDLVYFDLLPDTTRELAAWEAEFGLEPNADEATRRLALAAEWAATGGQSPAYIEGILQTAGFDVYVHEWWSSGPPYVARDPRSYTDQPLIGTTQCSAFPSQPVCRKLGAPADRPQFLCNRFLANDPGYLVNKTLVNEAPPPVPDDPNFWPFFMYIGGETFPDPAVIPTDRRAEFERLILKIRPTQQWIVVLVGFQDTYATRAEDAVYATRDELSGYVTRT